GLRLVPAAHDPEGDPHVSLAHERGNDRVERAFVASQDVWTAGVEAEKTTAVLQDEPGGGRYQAGTEPSVVALNVGNDVSLSINKTACQLSMDGRSYTIQPRYVVEIVSTQSP